MSTDAVLVPDPAHLPDDAAALKELVVQLYGTIQVRERRILQLEQHLHLLVKRFLHPASEKIDPRQLLLFSVPPLADASIAPPAPQDIPAAPEEQTPQKAPPRHTPHGRRRPPDTLEHRQVDHDLSPGEKQALGGEQQLVCIGENVTRKYEWTPSSVVVIEHHHKKYARCDAAESMADQEPSVSDSPAEVSNNTEDNGQAAPAPAAVELTPEQIERLSAKVIVARRPAEAIPGGVAGPGLLAQVIVSKYGDHLPLYRLERIFARQGVRFSRQTMCDWCAGCAKLLVPLTDLIRDEVLSSFVIHTDDTPVKVRDAHAKRQFQARFWTYLGDTEHPMTWFDFTNTRQRAGPDRVLAKYTGYLQADGYGGYDDYEGVQLGADSPILKVACWAHAGASSTMPYVRRRCRRTLHWRGLRNCTSSRKSCGSVSPENGARCRPRRALR